MATLPASAQSDRIITLDVIRGIAVMGIFSVNVVGMAMIQIAYFYPPAFGFDHMYDHVMWLVNFLLIDGKMRSIFSILFGASMLLVIDRAVQAGRSAWRTHYARMAVLLVLGWLHFALLWWGDILTHYAAVGMLAFIFWKLRARNLLILSIVGFIIFSAPGAYFFSKEAADFRASQAPNAPVELKKKWDERLKDLKPDAKAIAEDRAEHRNIATRVKAVVPDDITGALDLGPLWFETLALMLLGMAGYKSGFLTGQWDDRSYRKVAWTGISIGLTCFAGLAALAWQANFAPLEFMIANRIAAPPLRPITAVGLIAFFILMFRHRSAIRDRLAAVGRTAFSNYLGCTIIGTCVFYGFGGDLYAKLSRGQAWLLVPPVWALMLLWSKPWLERFNYGPFEWLWRSLARGKVQPMRKQPPEPLATPAEA